MAIKKIRFCFLCYIFLVILLAGCAKSSNAGIVRNTDDRICSAEDFVADLKEENKNIKLEDVGDSFLKGDRRSITYGKEYIDVYIYKDNDEMEADSEKINSDGYEYRDGNNFINVEWASAPHFYKKGTIIVGYAGKDKKIIENLKDILGEQFAGL